LQKEKGRRKKQHLITEDKEHTQRLVTEEIEMLKVVLHFAARNKRREIVPLQLSGKVHLKAMKHLIIMNLKNKKK
jgi:hypothetical protein